MRTRTGSFSIGIRRGGGEWQKDIDRLIAWAKDNGIEALDLGRDGETTVGPVVESGLRVGSVDLAEWHKMLSPDGDTRKAAVARNTEYIKACSAHGPMNYFLVMLPENKDLPRAENFGYMVESFTELVPVLEENKSTIVIEGWPGPGALCCTPEGYKALFKEVPSKAMGVNYDPSHLIRMGIDPIRFLKEVADRVYHIHGKDTEIIAENVQEYGTEQPPTFGKGFRFGSICWRYTIPGHGQMRWLKAFEILKDVGYAGCISIELEDQNFNGSEAGEQLGYVLGANFLKGC